MADTLKNLQYMTINKGMKHIIGGDKMSHFPDMRIQDDSTLYAKLLEKKRSTFDRSKFTVVGNPTITDDGIASGFSNGNYLKTPLVNLSVANSWTIVTPWFSFSDLQGRKDIVSAEYGTINGSNIYVILNASKHIEMRIAYQNWSSFLAPVDITNIVVNKKYQTKIEFTGTKYNFYYRSEDNMNWTQTSDGGFVSNTKVALNNIFGVGANQDGNSVATNASIDLKQFSIIVDGVEVLNGNKTGIDQITEDKVTFIENSSSTLTNNNGILSNFSVNGYAEILSSNTGYDFSKPFELDYSIKSPRDFSLLEQGKSEIPLAIGVGLLIWFTSSGTIQYRNDKHSVFSNNFTVKEDTWYDIRIIAKNNSIQAFFKERSVSIYTAFTDARPVSEYFNETKLQIGRMGNAWYCLNTSIDLASIKFTDEYGVIYRPYYYIPYTQSKTDEKIVDAVYRDRVQDMYEQFGYTHYYTIGDVSEKYNVSVVGNPTLVGGIASGFSSSDTVNAIPFSSLHTKSWEIQQKYYYNSTSMQLLGLTGNQWAAQGGVTIYNNKAMNFHATIGDSSESTAEGVKLTLNNAVTNEGWYIVKLRYDKTTGTYTLSSYNSNMELVVSGTYTPTITNKELYSVSAYPTALIQAGGQKSGYGATGSIDLSQFSIEVDGKEVFRGYEPAITDAFTLATNKGTDIIESYSDGEGTYYEVRADLVQRCVGIIPINTTEVNYPRGFRDARNIVQVAYFNVGESTATPTIAHIAPKVQTKSGFTIGATTNLPRNYYAEGKAVLG